MASRLQEEIGFRLRLAAPSLVGLASLLLMMVPLGSALAGYYLPNLLLIVVYYYTIHRPLMMPPPVVAALGVIYDLASGGPLGISAILLLITQMVLINQQSFFRQRHFIVSWAGFALVAAVAFPLLWLLASAYTGAWQPLDTVLFNFVITIGTYPFFVMLLDWLQRRILD